MAFQPPGPAGGRQRPLPIQKAHSLMSDVVFGGDNNQPEDTIDPPASAKKPNPRETFQRSASQPTRMDGDATGMLRPTSEMSRQPAAPSMRSAIFGSCSQVLGTVVTVLFRQVCKHRSYVANATGPIDNNTVRKAKLLYVQLLEHVQKERGEWQGFAAGGSGDGDGALSETAMELLSRTVVDLSKEDAFAVLNELVEVSFRNLRVSVVPPAVYAKFKKGLVMESLDCPPALQTLLIVRSMLNELNRDEKILLLRLVSLWSLLAVIDSPRQDLRCILEERQQQIFSECSEMEFMTARKNTRQDPTGVDVLMLLAHYRDVLFSDLEFFMIRQEMQLPGPAEPPAESPVEEEAEVIVEEDTSDIPLAVPVEVEERTDASKDPLATAETKAHAPSSPQKRSLLRPNHGHGPVVTVRLQSVSPKKMRSMKQSHLDAEMRYQARAATAAAATTTSDAGLGGGTALRHRAAEQGPSPKKKRAIPQHHHHQHQQHAPKASPPLPHTEARDLAKNYFSFSMAAATLCTVATMAVYAIRRQNN